VLKGNVNKIIEIITKMIGSANDMNLGVNSIVKIQQGSQSGSMPTNTRYMIGRRDLLIDATIDKT
jgi:hypothetical protein